MKQDDIHESAIPPLGSSEIFHREACHHAGTAMALVGRDQSIIRINEAWSELLGFSESELIGTRIGSLGQHRNMLQESECLDLFVGRRDRLEQRRALIHKNGRVVRARIAFSPVPGDSGQAEFVVATIQDIGRGPRCEDELTFVETHDGLTHLLNRCSFLAHLDSILSTQVLRGHDHVLCHVDIDQFKLINDTLGHAAGDHLLYQLSGLIRRKIRKSDILGRLGGDEFGILMVDCSTVDAQVKLAELASAIAGFRFFWYRQSYSVTVSIGMAIVNTGTAFVPSAELVKQAELACHAAKQNGRNRIRLFSDDDGKLARMHDDMLLICASSTRCSTTGS